MMNQTTCSTVATWMQTAQTATEWEVSPAIIEHVSTCHHCQGAALLLVTTELQRQQPLSFIHCDACQRQLPAFAEATHALGMQAAREQMPEVWLHCWLCPQCWELCTQLQQAVAAEHAGVLQPAHVNTMILPMFLTHIPRAVLTRAFPPTASHTRFDTRLRGVSPLNVVIDVEEVGEPRFTVRVLRSIKGVWELHTLVKPPPLGWLIVSVGELQLRAPFNREGLAVVQDIPEAFLTSPDEPDLVLSIDSA